MTFYYPNSACDPDWLFALDDEGELYCHPDRIAPDCRHNAIRQRALIFARIPEGLVPLIGFTWARRQYPELEDGLAGMESFYRKSIATGAPSYEYELASVSFPGEPVFNLALLRVLTAWDS
jgi:hypothetical protein